MVWGSQSATQNCFTPRYLSDSHRFPVHDIAGNNIACRAESQPLPSSLCLLANMRTRCVPSFSMMPHLRLPKTPRMANEPWPSKQFCSPHMHSGPVNLMHIKKPAVTPIHCKGLLYHWGTQGRFWSSQCLEGHTQQVLGP